MRIVSSRFLAITTLTLLAMSQLTWAWTKDYSYEHKMGDNDSRNLAKEAAIEQIKLKAAQEAGTYIQGTTTLTNGQLEETITQIGASIVKVVVKSDQISIDDTGHQLLTLIANATVDETVMQERIKALQEDVNKSKLLQQLAIENEKLRTDLVELAKQRTKMLDLQQLSAINSQEVAIRKCLVENINATEKIFKSLVSAIDLANQEAFLLEKEFEKIETEWVLNFFQPLREPKIIKADLIDLKLSDDGSYYSGRVLIELLNDPEDKIHRFICQQTSENCTSIKERCLKILDKGDLPFTYPVSMSKQNRDRFLSMIRNNLSINGYNNMLFLSPYVINAKFAGQNFVMDSPQPDYSYDHLVRCADYTENEWFIVPIDGLRSLKSFTVDAKDMKADPILRVEIEPIRN